MKKLHTFLLLILLISIPCFIVGQGKIPLKLGLKIAPNVGWMSPGTKGYSNDGARFGGTIGFVSDYYFTENYALSTGFNFQFLNGKLNYNDSMAIGGSNKPVYGDVNRKYNFLYLEIPVMIKMQTKRFDKISYYGQIGLGTGFRIKTTVKEHFVPASGDPVDQTYDFNGGTTLIRESVLVGVGLNYHLDQSTSIVIGLNYSNSLNNVLTGVNYKSKLNEKSMLNYAELNIGVLF